MIEDVDNDDNEASWVAGRSTIEGKPNQHFLSEVLGLTTHWYLIHRSVRAWTHSLHWSLSTLSTASSVSSSGPVDTVCSPWLHQWLVTSCTAHWCLFMRCIRSLTTRKLSVCLSNAWFVTKKRKKVVPTFLYHL